MPAVKRITLHCIAARTLSANDQCVSGGIGLLMTPHGWDDNNVTDVSPPRPRLSCCVPVLLSVAAFVLVLSGTSHHNGDPVVDTDVADSRSIFFTQSIYRCNPRVHVVCEVCCPINHCCRAWCVGVGCRSGTTQGSVRGWMGCASQFVKLPRTAH
jgi:hypothetical protein